MALLAELVLTLSVLTRGFMCFSSDRPNFIFVLTDDQDLLLDSMNVMTEVKTHLIDEGITFSNAYVATPICCPSRTETLSGRYYHNIGFNTTNGTCMHIDAAHYTFFNESMFPLFQSNGYITGMFGKLTNDMSQWCGSMSNPKLNGFDRIYAMCQQANYYDAYYFDKYPNNTYFQTNYTNELNDNSIGFNFHQTALIGNKTIDFLHSISDQDSPFLLWIGPHSPHEPAVPPMWYGNAFSNISAPNTPNFNLSSPDKHQMVAESPPLNDTAKFLIDNLYRDRLRSLLSVNDIVAALFNDVFDKYDGLLNNTYIIYTSDHGFHLGQWTIACYKAQMYETDIHVPFYIRGPNLINNKNNKNSGTSIDNLIGNVDILPTLLDLANINIPENIDGKSFADKIVSKNSIKKRRKNKNKNKIVSNKDDWRTMFLVQFKADPQPHCFGMCNVWFADESDTNSPCYPGRIDNPPCGPHGMVQPWWYVNDPVSNNYRALRIINDTHNIVYSEFVNWSWTIEDLKNPNFYEYYNISEDPYQMYNLYNTLTQHDINYYHDIIMTLGQCSGLDCP